MTVYCFACYKIIIKNYHFILFSYHYFFFQFYFKNCSKFLYKKLQDTNHVFMLLINNNWELIGTFFSMTIRLKWIFTWLIYDGDYIKNKLRWEEVKWVAPRSSLNKVSKLSLYFSFLQMWVIAKRVKNENAMCENFIRYFAIERITKLWKFQFHDLELVHSSDREIHQIALAPKFKRRAYIAKNLIKTF